MAAEASRPVSIRQQGFGFGLKNALRNWRAKFLRTNVSVRWVRAFASTDSSRASRNNGAFSIPEEDAIVPVERWGKGDLKLERPLQVSEASRLQRLKGLVGSSQEGSSSGGGAWMVKPQAGGPRSKAEYISSRQMPSKPQASSSRNSGEWNVMPWPGRPSSSGVLPAKPKYDGPSTLGELLTEPQDGTPLLRKPSVGSPGSSPFRSEEYSDSSTGETVNSPRGRWRLPSFKFWKRPSRNYSVLPKDPSQHR
ncbi:hypothetical protein [Sporisorium scitamineum]|nr:hypothetical protein [Sporisorium scitamineum]